MWPSLSREQLEAAVGVVMRVPGLFIIDYWWQHDRNKSLPNSVDGAKILNAVVTNLVLLHGFLLLLLPLSYVRALYTHFVSGALIISAHLLSSYYVQMEEIIVQEGIAHSDNLFLRRQLALIAFHALVAMCVTYLLQGPWKPFPPALACYMLPVLSRLADFPVDTLQYLHNFSSAFMAFHVFLYVTTQVPKILDCVKLAYMDAMLIIEVYGFMTCLTVLWNKLFVPTHFAVFWLIEFVVKLIGSFYSLEKSFAWGDKWYIVVLSTMSSICASPVTLVATSVSISYLSFFVLCATRAFLQGHAAFFPDNPMHSGWTEGLTLILLAMQTGLTEVKMPARMSVMTIILFIVLSSLLQSMLEITEPVVLALSASRSQSISRHLRALSLCFILFAFPLYLTYVLSTMFPIDFWMMVVLSSCTLTSVQVLDLLVVHSLFVYDSERSEPWDNLDDIVYYTRAATKIMEFLVAVFVVGMGLWEYTSAKWNWVNASILLVHCYFNVWQRLQTGWRSFLLRREVVKKAESLPSATEEQLAKLNDICAICFGSMKAACVTPCQHYFHRTCLRKWLYVQDKCPLCHAKVSLPPPESEKDAAHSTVSEHGEASSAEENSPSVELSSEPDPQAEEQLG